MVDEPSLPRAAALVIVQGNEQSGGFSYASVPVPAELAVPERDGADFYDGPDSFRFDAGVVRNTAEASTRQ